MLKLMATISLVFALMLPTGSFADTVRIAALGDSLTQGFGLREDLGFVPQLQAWLTQAGADAQVINAGVSGDTTAGGLSRVDWTLSDNVDAMIVALGGNDLLRGIPPEAARANLTGIMEAAQASGVAVLLVGMQAPGNYGPDYKAAFDGIYPELAGAYDAVFLDSFFAGLPSVDPAELGAFLQGDGVHPNAKGVALIVEGFGPKVLELIKKAKG